MSRSAPHASSHGPTPLASSSPGGRALALAGLVALVWAGLVIGISFVEAPTKFTAPTLTRAVALDVGRVVFAMSHRVQLVLAGILAAAALAARREQSTGELALVATLIALFAVQLFGVQPRLDVRTVRILAGETLPGSHLHTAYVVADLVKLSLLLSIGWRALRRR